MDRFGVVAARSGTLHLSESSSSAERTNPIIRFQAGVAAHDAIPAQIVGQQAAAPRPTILESIVSQPGRRPALPAAAARRGVSACRARATPGAPDRWD